MRCPSCNKFPAFDTSTEPEADVSFQDMEMDYRSLTQAEKDASGITDKTEILSGEAVRYSKDAGTVRVGGSVRIVLASECCGDECKEATFDIDDLEVEFRRGEGCPRDFTSGNFCWNVEGSGEVTDRSETQTKTIAKRGPNKGKEVVKCGPHN